MKGIIKVFLADDHPLILEGIKKILDYEPDLSVIGSTTEGDQVVQEVKRRKPDVVVLDLSFPEKSGLDLLEDIRGIFPDLPVLILSMYPEQTFAIRAIKAGASGYVTKQMAPEILVKAIRKVARGERFLSPEVMERLVNELGRNKDRLPHQLLSDREFQVMMLLASGKSVKEITEVLSLDASTVYTYRARILKKMNLKNNSEIIFYAVKNNLLE
ncbi:MAG: response regulator transcription factor [Calditrichia bacterium]